MGNIIREKNLTTRLAIYGGSFDPIHHGHLWVAKKIPSIFSTQLRLIPNGAPPHRQSLQASWQHRVEMCRLATEHLAGVEVGEEESPEKIRYTLDTLIAVRQNVKTLLLFIGSDAYASLDKWYQWQRLFDYAHIIVIDRPQNVAQPSPRLAAYCQKRSIKKADIFSGVGGIYFWKCNPPAISSTEVRRAIRSGTAIDNDAGMVLPAIRQYSQQNALYGYSCD